MQNIRNIADVIAKVAGWTVVLLVVFTLGNCALMMHADKKALRELAQRIHGQCRAEKICPATLPGWRKSRSGLFFNGAFYYAVADDRKTFRLNRHLAPDWDYEATGGVQVPLVFDENMH